MKIKEFSTDRIAYYNWTGSLEHMPEDIEAEYIYTDSIDHIEITKHVSRNFPYCVWIAGTEHSNMKIFQETVTREEAVTVANQLQKDIVAGICSEKYGSDKNAKMRRPSLFYPAVFRVRNPVRDTVEIIAAFKTEKDKDDFVENHYKEIAENVLNDESKWLIKNDADPFKATVLIWGKEMQLATAKSMEETVLITDDFYKSFKKAVSRYLEACGYYDENQAPHLNDSILGFYHAANAVDDKDPFKQAAVRIVDKIKKVDALGCDETVLELFNECLATATLTAKAYNKVSSEDSRNKLLETINIIEETVSGCETKVYENKLEEMIEKSNKITEELNTTDLS